MYVIILVDFWKYSAVHQFNYPYLSDLIRSVLFSHICFDQYLMNYLSVAKDDVQEHYVGSTQSAWVSVV